MSRLSPKGPVALIALASGVGLVALAAVVTRQPKLAPEPLKPGYGEPKIARPASTAHHAPQPAPTKEERPLVQEDSLVKVVALNGDEPELSRTVALREGQEAKAAALEGSIHGLGYSDVRVIGTTLAKGVLMIDVSPQLRAKGFGSMAESNFIKAIQMTLAQFPEVKSFQFRCDGKIIDTLGHFEMTEPLPVHDAPETGGAQP